MRVSFYLCLVVCLFAPATASFAIEADFSNAVIVENSPSVIKIDKIYTVRGICWAEFEWNNQQNILGPINYDCLDAVLMDTFTGTTINDANWTVFGMPENGDVWQDERLYIQKEAVDSVRGVGVKSNFGLAGDFDIRVEWDIEEMVRTAWDVEMRLVVNFDGDWVITMRDARFGYSFCWNDDCFRGSGTADMEGTLRLTRTGDTIRSYLGPVGAVLPDDFSEIGSGHVLNQSGPALQVNLDLYAWGENDIFYGSFDNFFVTEGDIIWND